MRRPLAFLLALLALGAVACGSDDDSADSTSTTASTTTTTDPGLSKDEFVRQANAICKDTNSKTNAVAEPKRAADYPAAIRQIIGFGKEGQAKLRALRAPAADRATIESQFLALNDQQIQTLEAALPALDEAAKTGSMSKVEAAYTPAITKFGELAATQESFAKPYGLTDCTG